MAIGVSMSVSMSMGIAVKRRMHNFIKSLILMVFLLVEKFPVDGKFENFERMVFVKTNSTIIINLYSVCVQMIAK